MKRFRSPSHLAQCVGSLAIAIFAAFPALLRVFAARKRPMSQDYRAVHQLAFHRSPLLDQHALHAATPILGNVERLRRKLQNREPVTIAAIGSSNVVRGGCQEWQNLKCSHPKYTNRSADDGTRLTVRSFFCRDRIAVTTLVDFARWIAQARQRVGCCRPSRRCR